MKRTTYRRYLKSTMMIITVLLFSNWSSAQLSSTSSATAIFCNAGTSSVTVSATGGTPPYTGTGNFTVSAGPYSYTVTDANSNSSVTTGTVSEPTQLVATIAGPSAGPCYGVNEAVNGDFQTYTGNITSNNTWINNNLANWSVSHGTPSTNGNLAIWMWSYSGYGEGVYNGYNFVAGQEYQVTYDLYQATDANPTAQFFVRLNNNLSPSSSGNFVPTTTGTQLVSSLAWSLTGGVQTITETFTASSNYSQLWFYPYLTGGPTPNQATCTIDNITISQVVPCPSTGILCNGETTDVTVTATGGTAPYTGTGTYTVEAGTHSYTVTDANGCSVVDSTIVSEPTQLVATISSTSIDCNGGTTDVTVTAIGGTAPYIGTGTFTVVAGAYSYTVTDANGCSVVDSTTVSESTQLVATIAGPSAGPCYGVNEAVNGDFQTYTGNISQTNSFINNNVANWNVSHGTPSSNGNLSMYMWSYLGYGEGVYMGYNFVAGQEYQLTYEISQSTDANPTAQFFVRLNSGMNPNSSTTIPSTAGTQVVSNIGWSLAGGVQTITETFTAGSNYSQLWFYPYLAGSPTPNQAASVIDNIVIKQVIPCPSSEILCNGGTTDIIVTATGGIAPYTGTGTFTVGAGTHLYTVIDANGCSVVDSTIVSEPAQLAAAISSTSVDCNGETTDITVTATGGTAPYTGTGTYTVLAGAYSYTVTDANGCSVVVSTTVSVPTQLAATISSTSIDCNGGTTDVTVTATGGTAPYTGTGTYTVGAGTHSYTVTDANGCSVVDSTTVSEPTQLVATISSTSIDCTGGSSDITVTATGGTAPYSGNGTYTVLAGTHSYSVTDANGCSVVVSTTVSEPIQIEANITPQNHVIDCIPIPVTLTANPTGGTGGPYTYLWSTGETTASIQVNPNSSTTYTVVVTDANGCAVNTGTNGTTVTVLNRCGNNNQKVLICKIPPGNRGNQKTICISQNALNAHLSSPSSLNGGSYCGPCTSSKTLTLGDADKGKNTFIRAGININNKSIDLSYRIGYDSKVQLEIYDLAGKLIDVVHTAQANEGKLYEFKVNTYNISTGVYIYQFITDSETIINKLQIIQ